MRKNSIFIINAVIFILCFLFLLSSSFKVVSYTFINDYICKNAFAVILVWIFGVSIASFFTRPLYRWILRLRHL